MEQQDRGLGGRGGTSHLSCSGRPDIHRRCSSRARLGGTYGRLHATELQVAEAQRLLLAGTTARDIARMSGFAHPSHFTHRFKLMTLTSPARWLRGHRGRPALGELTPCLFLGELVSLSTRAKRPR